jgi:hypothetical protein
MRFYHVRLSVFPLPESFFFSGFPEARLPGLFRSKDGTYPYPGVFGAVFDRTSHYFPENKEL